MDTTKEHRTMADIKVVIAVEDWMLLEAFIDWAERNSIECTKIYGGSDLCFKINGKDFNSFIYEYFLIKVDV